MPARAQVIIHEIFMHLLSLYFAAFILRRKRETILYFLMLGKKGISFPLFLNMSRNEFWKT
jgi:hypothetical protein